MIIVVTFTSSLLFDCLVALLAFLNFDIFKNVFLFRLNFTLCLILVMQLKTDFSLLKHGHWPPKIQFIHAICWVFCRLPFMFAHFRS